MDKVVMNQDCALCGIPMSAGSPNVCDHCRIEDMVDNWDYPTDDEDSEVGPDHDGYYE